MTRLYNELKRNLAEETLCAVATIVSGSENVGAEMLVYPDGDAMGDLGNGGLLFQSRYEE